MTKKIYWTLSVLIPISLPVFSVISCSSQTSQTGTSEAAEFSFLNFKSELVRAASQTPLSDVQSLKDRLLREFGYNPIFKMGLKSLDVKVEGNFFILDYEIEAPKGPISVFAQDPSKLPPDREILKGTIKAAGRKN